MTELEKENKGKQLAELEAKLKALEAQKAELQAQTTSTP
jgi:hypothetical protein